MDTLTVAQQRLGGVLPQQVLDRFTYLREELKTLQSLSKRMVPQALKDLNNRLQYIQKLMYQGEWHTIPGAGKYITRETEARLINKPGKMEWELKEAPFPQNKLEDFEPKRGWPNFEEGSYAKRAGEAKRGVSDGLRIVQSFNGPMKAIELTEGQVIYRVIDAQFGKSVSEYWMYLDPKSIKGQYWRIKFAVLQRFSHNGQYVKYTIPKGKTLRAWEGKVSSQIDNNVMQRSRVARHNKNGAGLQVVNQGFGQFLEGGETQLFIDFKFDANAWAAADVDTLQKLETHWPDHMDINLVPSTAEVQKLGTYVEEQKTLAAANLSTAANVASKLTRGALYGTYSSQ